MKSFRELRVWQQAMDLVEKVYLLTQDFPKQETYGLMSQVRRAVISVPSRKEIRENTSRNTFIIFQWPRLLWRKSKHNLKLQHA